MARYLVEGMTCDGCARAVTRALQAALPGRDVVVDRAAGSVEIGGDPVDETDLRGAVTQAGFVYRGPG